MGKLIGLAFKLALAALAAGALYLAFLYFTTPDPHPSPGWAGLTDMPSPRGEVASTAVDDSNFGCNGDSCENAQTQLIVAGGMHGSGKATDVVSIYQSRDDTWGRGPLLPAPRHHGAAAALDGAIYFTGGTQGVRDWTPEENLWTLRPGSKRWEELPEMPEGRLGHAMVALGGKLYVLGGDGESGDTLVFDPAQDRWERQEPIPDPRNHLTAVTLEGEIWVIGGRDEGVTKRVDIYDPETEKWRNGPALPEPMSAMGIGVIDGDIHVVGGENPDTKGGGVIDAHYVLRSGQDNWREAPRPMLAVHGAAGGVIEGRLIIAGGASRQGAFSVVSWTGITQAYEP